MTDRLSPREILEQLISFPTVSRDSNLPLVDWVENYLASHDIQSHRYWHEDRTKAALFAHVGPSQEGAIVLSGHTDVVPVDGQPWTSDPFVLTEREGKLYGRGTCDMKGFDALAIWALVEARYSELKRPLQIALSYDEEIGCTGAPPMIDAMQPVLPKGSVVFVGEPSMMKVVTGHKGGFGFDTHVVGYEVHSSIMHTGVDAVMESAKLINWADERNAENASGTDDPIAAMFDPPYSTCHVGKITGGTANNITARDCYFTMSFRNVPSETPDYWSRAYQEKVAEVQEQMQSVHPDARIDIKGGLVVPGLRPEENGEAETLARRITGDNSTNVVSYCTEAGQFQDAGYSVVVCGPGDIAQAHQPDEYLTIAQLEAGTKFMKDLIRILGE